MRHEGGVGPEKTSASQEEHGIMVVTIFLFLDKRIPLALADQCMHLIVPHRTRSGHRVWRWQK